MSAKLTIIFFILICFEIGLLLVVLPWLNYPPWDENYLLFLVMEKLQWPWLGRFMTSGYMRGAVTGLGLLNILLGVWEIINFNKTVRTFQMKWQGGEIDSEPFDPSSLPDNRPADASAHRE